MLIPQPDRNLRPYPPRHLLVYTSPTCGQNLSLKAFQHLGQFVREILLQYADQLCKINHSKTHQIIKIKFFGFTGAGRGHTESLPARERAGRGAKWTGRGGSGVCFEKLFTGRSEAVWQVLLGGPRGASKFHASHISGIYNNDNIQQMYTDLYRHNLASIQFSLIQL